MDSLEEQPVQQLIAVSGLPIGDVRAILSLLFESRPLNEDSRLSPGETAVILAFDTLSRMGYTRDRIVLILKAFLSDILDFMKAPHETGKLGLLMIHDNRYVMWETARTCYFDLKTSELRQGSDALPLPVTVVSLSVLGLYLRTFAKTQDRPTSAAARRSASPGAVASAVSDPAPCQPDPSQQ